jgi:hypothetical protein
VITPRVPSLPRASRSGLGPAAEAGSRRDAHTPAGVISQTASTRSSTCVGPVAKCPAARMASQPPTVERSKDWGKNRKSGVAAQGRHQVRPGRPGQHPGRLADRVDLGHAGQGAQVKGHDAGEAVPHGRPAADDPEELGEAHALLIWVATDPNWHAGSQALDELMDKLLVIRRLLEAEERLPEREPQADPM